MDARERAAFRALVERRAAGEPVAYLLGRREFYGRIFRVDARVLVPRPETEHLVDEALAHLSPEAEGPVLDLCSGSGCIGLTLLCERPALRVEAVELAPDAAALALENAERLGVAERYTQHVGDLFAPLEATQRFVLLTANPPYVDPSEWPDLPPEVRREPRGAVIAEAGGLSVARRILEGGRTVLRPDGLLLIEHGEAQGPALRDLALGLGYQEVRDLRDLAGHDRVLVARA
ncbi:MAG: peptide chain release factor N(5)-glutamine methyltransferase [Deltaproteobacteria bacterium]|nr:MAG: peptide chain release factor N(5)-glutamine methyltransferase [Deltaproteobacteria bacterium]